MMRLPTLALAALLAASCGSPGPESLSGASEDTTEIRTRADLERYAGQEVAVEGTFDHVGATHAKVTLRSGLVIFIPHFDKFRRGDDWLKYVGRQVRVEGVVHTYTSVQPEITGPSIEVRHFEALDLTE